MKTEISVQSIQISRGDDDGAPDDMEEDSSNGEGKSSNGELEDDLEDSVDNKDLNLQILS